VWYTWYTAVLCLVVLMDGGDVCTFGSNQFGQLGTGDTAMRSVEMSQQL